MTQDINNNKKDIINNKNSNITSPSKNNNNNQIPNPNSYNFNEITTNNTFSHKKLDKKSLVKENFNNFFMLKNVEQEELFFDFGEENKIIVTSNNNNHNKKIRKKNSDIIIEEDEEKSSLRSLTKNCTYNKFKCMNSGGSKNDLNKEYQTYKEKIMNFNKIYGNIQANSTSNNQSPDNIKNTKIKKKSSVINYSKNVNNNNSNKKNY